MLLSEMRRLEPEAVDYMNVRRALRSKRPSKTALIIDVFAAATCDEYCEDNANHQVFHLAAQQKAHWPGAAASDIPIETRLNRLLPVQCSKKLGHSFVISTLGLEDSLVNQRGKSKRQAQMHCDNNRTKTEKDQCLGVGVMSI